MQDDSIPYWRLLSVLFSSIPLTPPLANRLLHQAYDLYRHDREAATFGGDFDLIVSGEIRNLKRDVSLGTFAGPVFEANVETERGKGTIRFFMTRDGLELFAEKSRSALN